MLWETPCVSRTLEQGPSYAHCHLTISHPTSLFSSSPTCIRIVQREHNVNFYFKGFLVWISDIVNIDECNGLSKRSWIIIGSLEDKIPTKSISPFHSVNGWLQASSVISLSSELWGLCDQLSPAEAGGTIQCITRCKPHKQQHLQVWELLQLWGYPQGRNSVITVLWWHFSGDRLCPSNKIVKLTWSQMTFK